MGGRLDPVEARARRELAAVLGDVHAGRTVVLGVSGGADSLALAAVAAFVSRRDGWQGEVVVVDHQLQAGSDAVARRALDQCEGLGLRGRIVPVEVGAGGGPEDAARRARHTALASVADELDAAAICLAHTLDDQAETVLLGLGRGSGPRSLAGMAPVSGMVRRPLLGLRRTETEHLCRIHGLDPWHDPHNSDPRHRRVRIRHELLPLAEEVLGGGLAEALARTADQFRADGELLDEMACSWLADHDAGDRDALRELPGPLLGRVLRKAALTHGATPGELAAVHVDALVDLVTAQAGGRTVQLPGAVQATIRAARLTFAPTPVAG